MFWRKLSLKFSREQLRGSGIFGAYAVVFTFGVLHLLTHLTGLPFHSSLNTPLFCVLTGILWLLSVHLLFLSLWTRLRVSEMRLKIRTLQNPSFLERETAPPSLATPLAVSSAKVNVLFSSDGESDLVRVSNLLRAVFIDELGDGVEVVSKKNVTETLCAVTDHVFDLVILSLEKTDAVQIAKLVEAIKKLDRNIPVILFTNRRDSQVPMIDGHYSIPESRKDVRSLADYVRREMPASKQTPS